jgi:hypothetical protein
MSRELISLRGSSRSRASAVWIAAAALLFVPGLWQSRLPSLGTLLRIPRTPVDLTWDRYAHFWSFLKEARHHVPAGQSYTVIAPDRDDEMYLFMFSLGLFEKHVALPTSYYGRPAAAGEGARYVLAYRRTPSLLNVRLIARLEEGAVYERAARGQ